MRKSILSAISSIIGFIVIFTLLSTILKFIFRLAVAAFVALGIFALFNKNKRPDSGNHTTDYRY